MEEALRKIKEKREAAEQAKEKESKQDLTSKRVKTDGLKHLSPHKEAPFSPIWQKPGEFDPGSAVIVNDIILFAAHTESTLLYYFTSMHD